MSNINDIKKRFDKANLSFMFLGIVIITISIISLTIFVLKGLYFLHPIVYILWLICGLGFTVTAVISRKEFYKLLK